jgi:hypothetical protein
MNLYRKSATAPILLLMLSSSFCTLQAEDQTQTPGTSSSPRPKSVDTDSGWHLQVAPYLWFPGMHGVVGAEGHDASVNASPADLLSHFRFGLMGVIEPRYNRIVMPLDFLWMRLGEDKSRSTENISATADVKVKEFILTPKIGYRIVDAPRVKVDALAGFRYWHLGTSLDLSANNLSRSFSQSANWVDFVGGAKMEAQVSSKAYITIAGNAGGGAANSDYEVFGGLGYRVTKSCVLVGGWRYMSVNYRPSNGFVYDNVVSGVLIGATFNMK